MRRSRRDPVAPNLFVAGLLAALLFLCTGCLSRALSPTGDEGLFDQAGSWRSPRTSATAAATAQLKKPGVGYDGVGGRIRYSGNDPVNCPDGRVGQADPWQCEGIGPYERWPGPEVSQEVEDCFFERFYSRYGACIIRGSDGGDPHLNRGRALLQTAFTAGKLGSVALFNGEPTARERADLEHCDTCYTSLKRLAGDPAPPPAPPPCPAWLPPPVPERIRQDDRCLPVHMPPQCGYYGDPKGWLFGAGQCRYNPAADIELPPPPEEPVEPDPEPPEEPPAPETPVEPDQEPPPAPVADCDLDPVLDAIASLPPPRDCMRELQVRGLQETLTAAIWELIQRVEALTEAVERLREEQRP